MQGEYHYFSKPQQVTDWSQFIIDNWEWTRGIAVKSELNNGREARTLAQNSAIHLWFKQMSDALNENGLTQLIVIPKLRAEHVLWTPPRFKESIFKAAMQGYCQKQSTKLITKFETAETHELIKNMFLREFPEYAHVLPLDMPHKELIHD